MTTMLYRPADAPNPEAWGLNLEFRVFDDAEIDAALSGGWVRHPSDPASAPDAPAEPEPKRKGRPPKGE